MSEMKDQKIKCLEKRVENLLQALKEYKDGTVRAKEDYWKAPVYNEDGKITGYEHRELGLRALVAIREDESINILYSPSEEE